MRIPCSVSLLTFNSEKGIARCLESLKDFEEIIVCDGNSTDRTREIAAAFGAKIISQYDTDEPGTPCTMDKAAVRQRAMSASTNSWRFFMDSGDTLSPEAIEEIRAITTRKNPSALIWRMPTRIFIAGSEILHEATYPSYQTRLVNNAVGAHFKNPVHDRLDWDRARFQIGTMTSYYDLHWSRERVAHYWEYLHAYVRREVQVERMGTIGDLIQWKIRCLRTIFGYVLWRLPTMYVKYGFKDSMPLSIELTIVRYHSALLFGMIGKYVRTRLWFVILLETLYGKDLNRVLSNVTANGSEAYGRVLDVGGSHGASYWRYLETRRWFKKTSLDIDPRVKPDMVLDLEKYDIPAPEAHFDTALLFNVLEHIRSRPLVLARIRKILKPGGALVGIVPFLVAVHPDPHDYARMTNEELEVLFQEAGFSKIRIVPVGRGPITASYYQSEFLWPRLAKLIILPFVLYLDALILRLRPAWRNKFPLSYFFEAR